eukprot:CAMPEP_0184672726 /NCGR_PEP_ID=MMETSP0308-20130426/86271_1 /TAXON_ID=38269 /ORGANISM="Gloeochaete witrockiana, Strain SAG 46.84" /LENGTH=643 /DNA_ID=CAMNT_0027120105 /DNA_START=32 /DNA_END=1963 /DNA_ORIENTATION=-
MTHRSIVACVTVAWAVSLCFASLCTSPIDFGSDNGQLLANGGTPFSIKGVGWFGFDLSGHVANGLSKQSADFILSFLANNTFNAVRFGIAPNILLDDRLMPGSGAIDYSKNPDMLGLSAVQVLDLLIDKLAQRNILVILSDHRNGALWHDSVYTDAMVLQSWVNFARRYDSTWNVIGAEFKNEAYGATWGSGDPSSDWKIYCEMTANAILAISPRMLMFVQGIGQSGWWGGDFTRATQFPIVLSNQKRLVYQPHVYAPGMSGQGYFFASNFPNNMPAIWDSTVGFLTPAFKRALILDWGSQYDVNPQGAPLDYVWQNAFVQWLLPKGYGFFWHVLDAASKGTNGLLKDDWTTPVTSKLQSLSVFPSTKADDSLRCGAPGPSRTYPPPLPTTTSSSFRTISSPSRTPLPTSISSPSRPPAISLAPSRTTFSTPLPTSTSSRSRPPSISLAPSRTPPRPTSPSTTAPANTPRPSLTLSRSASPTRTRTRTLSAATSFSLRPSLTRTRSATSIRSSSTSRPTPRSSMNFTCRYSVSLGDRWSRGGGLYVGVLNLNIWIPTGGGQTQTVPWVLAIGEGYVGQDGFWNVENVNVANGVIQGTARSGWEALVAGGARVPVGVIAVRSTNSNSNWGPQRLQVNNVTCVLG